MEDITEFTSETQDSGVHQSTNTLPIGARNFIREYAPQDDDSGCIVSFETVLEFKPFKSRQLQDKAEAEGRLPGPECEVHEDEIFIRINIRGNDKIEVHRRVRDEDKRRFPYAWQQYQRGKQILAQGTSLTLIGLDASVIRQYQARNVWTVEDLARVDDNNLANLGTNAREFRRCAQEMLAKQTRAAPPSDALQSQVNQLSDELKQAMELIREQQELLTKRGPGRPPKNQAA